ncbi:hypothetical protein [Thalassobius sp. Cn5-15]|uniref:hypothetical protein n=1 Tax=Thalassobius sp. Cn5-15 TaxID=2917763 RepID=UPI001EF2DE44|nr:hypothetical protein [Thalassobius sp. Cn5-15]MCG7492966.1 hypothetical protein [Thalassobius sp. Cn5-15]
MNYALLLAATAVVAAPTFASAEISGGSTIGFSQLSSPDFSGELDTTTFDFALDYYDAGPIGFGIEAGRTSFDDSVSDDALWNVDLEAFYRLNEISRLGAYVGRVSIGNVDLDSYGLIWGYDLGTTSFEASLGQAETDGDNITEFSLWSQFDATNSTRLAAEFATAQNDGDGIYTYALAAQHGLSDSFALFGNIRYTNFADTDTGASEVGVGVSYDLAPLTGLYGALSLELARTNLDSGGNDVDLDIVRFGVSLPFGGSGKAGVPLNSGASNVASGPRGVTAGLLSSNIGLF